MGKTLALIAAFTAAALLAQGAAQAARQDAVPASDSLDLLPPSSHAAKPPSNRAPPFHGLLGDSEAEVTARLGAPDLARAEGRGAMWTYRLPDCALFVFFRRSGVEPLHFDGATAGPRMRGRNPPPVNQCLTEAMSRHGAEPAKPRSGP